MALALPPVLGGSLTDREGIADALYRSVLAFDNDDEVLLRSALTSDVSAEMPGSSAKGIEEFKAVVYDRISKLDTTHFLSNIRISIASATKAQASCSALAKHVRPGKGFEPAGTNQFTSGGFYLLDLVKENDLWKISVWKANIIWVEGDPTVVA